MKQNQREDSASTTARRKKIIPNPNVVLDGKFKSPNNQIFPDLDIQEQFQASKKIHDLRFLKQTRKNKFFNTPFLTPITFVSKDQQMKADYILESDHELLERGPKAT